MAVLVDESAAGGRTMSRDSSWRVRISSAMRPHATVVLPFYPAHICWQERFNPAPLLVVQPKQVLAHDPDPPSKNESESYCQDPRINEF